MVSVDSKKRAATELTAGSDSAATEHTEVPQLAELVNQEAGSSTAIELKVIRNDLVDYTHPFNGNQVPTQKVQIILQSKSESSIAWVLPNSRRKTKPSSRKLPSAGRLAPHGGSKPSHASTTSRLIFTLHAASQSICASRRRRRCYRARLSHRRQCQQLPSPTYHN